MNKQEQQIAALQLQVDQLSRLVHSLSLRVKKLEQDNVRIKHDNRGTKMAVQSLSARTKGD